MESLDTINREKRKAEEMEIGIVREDVIFNIDELDEGHFVSSNSKGRPKGIRSKTIIQYTCPKAGCMCLVTINGSNITIDGGNVTLLSLSSFKCTDHNCPLESSHSSESTHDDLLKFEETKTEDINLVPMTNPFIIRDHLKTQRKIEWENMKEKRIEAELASNLENSLTISKSTSKTIGLWDSLFSIIPNVISTLFFDTPDITKVTHPLRNISEERLNLEKKRLTLKEERKQFRQRNHERIDEIRKQSEILSKAQSDEIDKLKAELDVQLLESSKKFEEEYAKLKHEADVKIQELMEKNNDISKKVEYFNERYNEMESLVTKLKESSKNIGAVVNEESYKDLKAWIESQKYKITYNDLKVIIGNKGEGKTTFAWLRGETQKPKKTLKDGTIEIHRVGEFLDTIGMNIEVSNLLKLFATFILTGVPDTLILCTNDRIDRALLVLNHVMITKPYVFMMNARSVHRIVGSSITAPDFTDEQVENIYDLDTYEEIVRDGWAVTPLTHKSEIPLNRNLRTAFENLMPGQFANLPSWEEFQNDFKEGETTTTLRFQICKFLKQLVNDFGGDKLAFINNVRG